MIIVREALLESRLLITRQNNSNTWKIFLLIPLWDLFGKMFWDLRTVGWFFITSLRLVSMKPFYFETKQWYLLGDDYILFLETISLTFASQDFQLRWEVRLLSSVKRFRKEKKLKQCNYTWRIPKSREIWTLITAMEKTPATIRYYIMHVSMPWNHSYETSSPKEQTWTKKTHSIKPLFITFVCRVELMIE